MKLNILAEIHKFQRDGLQEVGAGQQQTTNKKISLLSNKLELASVSDNISLCNMTEI